MEIITFNDCRKCGSKPHVRAFGSLHLVTCPECLEETFTDPDLADLAKRWNEANPKVELKKEFSLSKAFSPIKEIRLTARIDDLDLETESESESESELESESEDETDLAPESEPCLPPGWSHATDFSSFKAQEEGPRDPNIPPVHPIHRCVCGGEPEFYSLVNGPICFICNKCRKMITGVKPFSEMIADWNKANPLDETERPNLDPGRGPCTCQGFDSPFQYQVGGDHYRRFSYQPVMFFRETHLDFDRANAIKYLARVGHKGDPVEDIEKAAQYLQFYEVRRMYENSLCEQFVNQIDEVPIRHAIRCLFSGEVTLAKMAIDNVLEMYRKPEDETK